MQHAFQLNINGPLLCTNCFSKKRTSDMGDPCQAIFYIKQKKSGYESAFDIMFISYLLCQLNTRTFTKDVVCLICI